MAEVTPGVVTPETPVAAPIATPEAPSTAEVVQPETQPEQPKERTFTQQELDDIVQKRIAKESRRAEKLGEERARREAAERELERLRARPERESALKEPKPEDFKGDYEGWIRALTKYDRQVEREQEQKQQQERQKEQGTQQANVEFARSFQAKVDAASEKYPDIKDRLLEHDEHFTPPMIAALDQLENGMDVAHHLMANNPKELARIAKLRAIPQVIAFYEAGKKLAEPPKTTNAPPPIVPNGQTGSPEKDPGKMSDKEFAAWRKRQIAQR